MRADSAASGQRVVEGFVRQHGLQEVLPAVRSQLARRVGVAQAGEQLKDPLSTQRLAADLHDGGGPSNTLSFESSVT